MTTAVGKSQESKFVENESIEANLVENETDDFTAEVGPAIPRRIESHRKQLRTSTVSTSSINENSLLETLGGVGLIPKPPRKTKRMTGGRQSSNYLKVDRKEVFSGDSITVCWNVSDPCHPNDWIGLFKADNLDPFHYLDHKERGSNAVTDGRLVWNVPENCIKEPESQMTVCLRYFRASGKVACTSENFIVKRHADDLEDTLCDFNSFTSPPIHPTLSPSTGQTSSLNDIYYMKISDISCSGLITRMFGPPNSYVKVCVTKLGSNFAAPESTEHYRTAPCTTTANPIWKEECFVFEVTVQSSITLEVRDTFVGSQPSNSHFLGKVEIWAQDFVTFDFECTHTLNLIKRIPSDNVSGTITFTVGVTKDHPDIPNSQTQAGSFSPSFGEDLVVPLSSPSGAQFQPTFTSNDRDVCFVSDQEIPHRTPSPINFCDDAIVTLELPRASREASVESQMSIRTAGSLDMLSTRDTMREADASPSPEPAADFAPLDLPPLEVVDSPVLVDQVQEAPPSLEVLSPTSTSSGGEVFKGEELKEPSPVPVVLSECEENRRTSSPVFAELTLQSDDEPLKKKHESVSAKISKPSVTSSDVPVVNTEEEEMVEQYLLMRNHLQHSRRRYSMKRQKNADDKVATLERTASLRRSATISGARRAYLKGSYGKQEAEPSNLTKGEGSIAQALLVDSRVDHHGRQYFMDHSSKTVAYGDMSHDDLHLDLQRRRIQLDRRYKSMRHMKRKAPAPEQLSPDETSRFSIISHDDDDDLSPTEPSGHEAVQPAGRERTTTVNENDQHIAATVLSKFRATSGRSATVSLVEPQKKRHSEGILAALKTGSLVRFAKKNMSSQDEKLSTMASEEQNVRETKVDSEEKMREKAVAVQMPGLQFLTRKDLYTLMSSAGTATRKFLTNRSLMELIQRIRADPSVFLKYQHSPVIIDMCNMFADKSLDLPIGWERKLNKEGKPFFVDHNIHKTTFIDPRLPVSGSTLPEALINGLTEKEDQKPQQVPLSFNPKRFVARSETRERDVADNTTEEDASRTNQRVIPATVVETAARPRLSYNEQVVEFLRQPDIFTTITARYRRQLRPQLRGLIDSIKEAGPSALESMSEDPRMLELTMILSLFDDEISNMQHPASQQPRRANTLVNRTRAKRERKKKAFEQKLQNFRYTLDHLGYAQNNRFRFNIRRENLLEDTYEHIMKSRVRHLQRKKLDVQFRGEEGLDYGGPSREFFFVVSREIFNPYYGLFEYSANDTYTVQVSPTSSFIENNLDWFKFAGRLVGLGIAQGYLLDVFFTRPLYKALLNSPPVLKDLEAIEPGIYSSLIWIQENDPEPLDLTFTVEEEAFGQLVEHELKEGGVDIPVTEANKHEYMDLMLRWRLDRGVQLQTNSFVSGFREIIPGSLVRHFDAQEIEFVIAGVLEVDVEDWRENTDYRNSYHAEHPVVKRFWRVVESFDNEQRLRLLQFVTGTSSVPFEGFKALKGSSGPKRFNIEMWGEPASLPRITDEVWYSQKQLLAQWSRRLKRRLLSHTCFNRLDLPPYPTQDDLYDKLVIAIEEGATFGIE